MSTMVVVTFSGVPIGMVIWGRTGWILDVTKTSLTSDVIRLDLPAPSSPHTHMRTIRVVRYAAQEREGRDGLTSSHDVRTWLICGECSKNQTAQYCAFNLQPPRQRYHYTVARYTEIFLFVLLSVHETLIIL